VPPLRSLPVPVAALVLALSARAVHRLFRLLLAGAALLLTRPAVAQVACPADSMDLGGYGLFTSDAARFDSSLTYFGTFRVAYDLPAGTVDFSQCCRFFTTYVQATDVYDVSGVPPGTTVSLVVQLTVDGSVSTTLCGGSGCSGTYGAVLTHGSSTDYVTHSPTVYSGSVAFHDVLQLPVMIVAGQPEPITFRLSGQRSPGGSHASEAHGVIGFTGLPPGVGITSCQGYAGTVTPARHTSWGRLKTLYR